MTDDPRYTKLELKKRTNSLWSCPDCEDDSDDCPTCGGHGFVDVSNRDTKLEQQGGTVRGGDEPGRNSPCSCGSGQKYKRCCLHEGE